MEKIFKRIIIDLTNNMSDFFTRNLQLVAKTKYSKTAEHAMELATILNPNVNQCAKEDVFAKKHS